MDIGTTAHVSASQYRAATAIGDGDVGQKGSFYRRQQRNKKQAEAENDQSSQSTGEDSKHTIDIRV